MNEECGFCGGPLPCLTHNVGITYNERLIQQMPKDKISDFASNSVIAKEIWNAAIEAAVKECLFNTDVVRIRKLKK